MSSGVAVTIMGRNGGPGDQFGYTHSASLYKMEGVRIVGPDTDATTVDAISIADTDLIDQVNLDGVMVYGFRDQLTMGSNAFLLKAQNCVMGHAHRRILSFVAQTNGGENTSFYGCTFYSSHNSGNTATGVYVDVDAQFFGASFYGCSFDYNDIEVDQNAGVLTFTGCHFEDNASGPMIKQSYTAGKHLSVMTISGGLVNPSEAEASARSHLIETKSGSGSGVYLTMHGPMFRMFNRFTKVYKNLSSSAPKIVHHGVVMDLSNTADVAAMGDYTSLLVNGNCETSTFLATAFTEGGWWREGTVTYSFDTAVSHSGTQSIKQVATGTAVTTSVGQFFPVQPLTTLAISFYHRIESMTTGSVQIRMQWFKRDGTTALSTSTLQTFSANTSGSGFVPYSQQVQVPQGASFVAFRYTNVSRDGTAYLDDATITAL
jgi:hypothetical protein